MDINQTRASDHSNSNNSLAILSHRHVTITDTDPGQQSSFRHRVTILELIRFRHHRPFALECIKTNPILHRTVSHFSVKSSLLRRSFVCSGMIHRTEITHTHTPRIRSKSRSHVTWVWLFNNVFVVSYFFFSFCSISLQRMTRCLFFTSAGCAPLFLATCHSRFCSRYIAIERNMWCKSCGYSA